MQSMKISPTANRRIEDFESSFSLNAAHSLNGPLFTGVDLGTTYIVTAVVDPKGFPVAGALTRSRSSIREGLILDYVGAISILREQIHKIHSHGFPLKSAAAAYPPGTTGRNARAFGNVLEAVGLDVQMLTDEPTAASMVLEITDGAVVDIGGGTTGISVIKSGTVVYTADEPTGGTHVDLVIAGHYKVQDHEAEKMKRDPRQQAEIFPLIIPVFQKMATIVKNYLRNQPVETLYLVGGTSCFPGIKEVMEAETGLNVLQPKNPLLVTPLGIALSLLKKN
jgi:ethanolamine utilization protein EutJ